MEAPHPQTALAITRTTPRTASLLAWLSSIGVTAPRHHVPEEPLPLTGKPPSFCDAAPQVCNTQVYVLLNKGNGIFANPVGYSTKPGAYQLLTADLNGDRKLDLITGISRTAQPLSCWVYAMARFCNKGSNHFLGHLSVPRPRTASSSSRRHLWR